MSRKVANLADYRMVLIRFRSIAITIFHPEIRRHFGFETCIVVVEGRSTARGKPCEVQDVVRFYNGKNL